MTFEELTNPKKYVRILDSTYAKLYETLEMIGGEFEVKSEYYSHNQVGIYNSDKSNYWTFNRSDVQFLTPIEFEGRKIGIGDTIIYYGDEFKVYGYRWYDGEFIVSAVRVDDYEHGCYDLRLAEITKVIPLYQEKVKEMTLEAVNKALGYKVKIIE